MGITVGCRWSGCLGCSRLRRCCHRHPLVIQDEHLSNHWRHVSEHCCRLAKLFQGEVNYEF